MEQQTAVEWLVENLEKFNGNDNPWFDIPLSLLEQAKQMEREQIEKAIDNALNSYGIINKD